MRKLFGGLFVALLMTAGLVAVSSSPASAACTDDAYVQCRETRTSINGPASKQIGRPVTFSVNVDVLGTNIAPQGQVRIVVRGVGPRTRGTTYFETRAARKSNFFTFGRQFPRGRYIVRAVYFGADNFQNSRSRTLALRNVNNPN